MDASVARDPAYLLAAFMMTAEDAARLRAWLALAPGDTFRAGMDHAFTAERLSGGAIAFRMRFRETG